MIVNINLMPQETVVQRYSFSIVAITFGASVALLAVLLTLGFISFQQANQITMTTAGFNSRLTLLQNEISTEHTRLRQQSNLGTISVSGIPFDIARFSDQLLQLQHSNVVISNLALSSGTVTLSGMAHSLSAIADYAQHVRSLSLVHLVSIQSATNLGQSGGYAFDMTVNVPISGGP